MAKRKSSKASKGKVSEDQIVREVMRKFGATINLRETPYVLIEILRAYGRLFDDGDGGSPPGGTPPPPPPPGPDVRRVDMFMLMQEILKVSREIQALSAKLGQQQG